MLKWLNDLELPFTSRKKVKYDPVQAATDWMNYFVALSNLGIRMKYTDQGEFKFWITKYYWTTCNWGDAFMVEGLSREEFQVVFGERLQLLAFEVHKKLTFRNMPEVDENG